MTALVKSSKALKTMTSTIRQHLDAVERAREIYLNQMKRAEAEYFDRIKRATQLVSGETSEVPASETPVEPAAPTAPPAPPAPAA